MGIVTMSSREFNQDVSAAKKAAAQGPVFVTDRGRLAHVLLSIDEYQRLTGAGQSIVDLLAAPEVAEIDFDSPRVGGFSRTADLG